MIGIAVARVNSGGSVISTDVRFFGGVDWASETHQVCLVAADGKIIGERAFAHGGAGLAEMCDWLVTTSGEEPPTVAVAIEVPHGPVVEILLGQSTNQTKSEHVKGTGDMRPLGLTVAEVR